MNAPPTFDAAAEHAALQAGYDALRACLAHPGAATVHPDRSGWSAMQHVDHVARSNQGICAVIEAFLAHPDAPGDGGGPTAVGCRVLASGHIPRGRGRAPAASMPATAPSPEAVAAALADSRAALNALAPHLPRLAALPGRRPHPAFGPLNAVEWLRFAHIHTRHHLAIIDDLLAP